MSKKTILFLAGDYIGPEITFAAKQVLGALNHKLGLGLLFDYAPIGGAAIDLTGHPLPADTLAKAKASDAILLGAVGGPKWDDAPVRPEVGLLQIRKELGLFANIRPMSLLPQLAHLSPLKPERVAGTDITVVRELTGGVYFGDRVLEEAYASDVCAYSETEIARVAHVAFKAAQGRRGKLCSVDKANVMATGKLWRRVVEEVAKAYPDVQLSHEYVDAAAMHMIMKPTVFDVILTENMFGDILSDEASVLAGSIGLLGSASMGENGPGLFEPIHGSAPDIAGEDKANPLGMFDSCALLLDMGLGLPEAAKALRAAVGVVLDQAIMTADIGGTATCSEVADAVEAAILA